MKKITLINGETTVHSLELTLPQGFPEVIVFNNATYTLCDWDSVEATYELTTSLFL